MTPQTNRHESASKQENAWFDLLLESIQPDQRNRSIRERLTEQCVRVALVVRLRWGMITALLLYVLLAELMLVPEVDLPIFHLDQWSMPLKAAALFFVLSYPLISLPCHVWRHSRLLLYLQVLVDLLFVTAVIHWSGGVISWFWPAYLLVTLEAAFLFVKKREVLACGIIGAVLYGLLLAAEHADFIAPVRMPFIEIETPILQFELLMWIWVAGLNAGVATFGAFLMGKIRSDDQKVRQRDDALAGFIATAHDLIFCSSRDGQIKYLNQVGQELTGCQGERPEELNLFDLTDEEGRALLQRKFDRLRAGEGVGCFEIRLHSTALGKELDFEVSLSPCSVGDVEPVFWGVCHDVTERNLAQRQLLKLAHHDILTGLPNRILLHDRLQQAKALSHRMQIRFALLFLDMDRFKIINDTLGHAVGDELLQVIAQRLKGCFRETDTVARIGGDEFVVLMLDVASRDDITMLCDKLMQELSQPFLINAHELFITTSGGVCIYPDDEEDVDAMMQKADIAMYHAKAQGRNMVRFYDAGMDQNASRRFTIINSMRRALDRGEFRLYYQPKLDVSSDRIIATEALVRWQHPELGLLVPTEFIQLAEENGMIVELGEWVLREACRQNVQWQHQGVQGLRVAVNLSGYQLQHSKIVDTVQSVLHETGMPGELLELEITESVIMQNLEYAVEVLNEIASLGVHISIDDFGTGYSSLSNLKRFNVNTLKIDKSFVRDVENSTTDAAIASAIIAMGNSLNLKIIAEGVETEHQMNFLRDNNCDQVQGFLISRPLPADKALALLREKCLGVLQLHQVP